MQEIPYIFNKLNEQLVYLLVFHAYINEMQVQEAKPQVKNLVRQRCGEGFNSGVKCLIITTLNIRGRKGVGRSIFNFGVG
jgi:hypothetical protein